MKKFLAVILVVVALFGCMATSSVESQWENRVSLERIYREGDNITYRQIDKFEDKGNTCYVVEKHYSYYGTSVAIDCVE